MGSKNYPSWLMLAVLGSNLPIGQAASPSSVTTDAQAAQTAQHDFSIPAGGSLASALLAFGQQSGLQLIAPSDLTAGLSSAGVQGRYLPDDALRALLSGTALDFKYVSTNTLQIYSAASAAPEGAEVLGEVRVDGAVDNAASFGGGVNGSQDVTATEGSGSLNGSMLTVGSKGATSVKDTPQSVSVITSETMQQQGIRTLNDAMQKATGITVQQGGNSREQRFYSRGFQITRATVDGGSPMDISGETNRGNRFSPSFDMSMYDHIEILRGADDLFNGFSTSGPGGTVNLVRKRPLDHYQLKYEGSAGSWNNYQNMLDLSSPLNDAGTLRGRGVLTWKESRHFYHTAWDDKKIAYGTLEADLTDTTLLTLGGSFQRIRGVPASNGLDLYTDGSDPHFSRKTAWVFPWEKADSDTREVFARLNQKIGDKWNLKLDYTGTYQRNSTIYSNVGGTINQSDQQFTSGAVGGDASNSNNKQFSFDSALNGEFDVLGLPQKLTVGANYSRQSYWATSPDADSMLNGWFGNTGPTMDPWNWDSGSVPAPSIPGGYYAYLSSGTFVNWGMYSQLVITPWKPLHFGLGLRLNAYKSNTHTSNASDQSDASESTRKWESPYYSISYDINDNLSWYGSYTNIFIPQSSMISPSGQQIDPQTGSNVETGLKYARPDGTLNASLSLYQIKLFNKGQILGEEVDLGGGRTGYYRNSPDADISKGIDFEVTGSVQPWWQTSLGYTYNINKAVTAADGFNQSITTFTPKHNIKWWNDFQFNDAGKTLSQFSFGLGVQAQSKTTQAGAWYDDDFNAHDYHANSGFYAVYSARVGYALNKNWNVALLANNLFDKTYYSTVGSLNGGYWYGEPRNFMLTLSGTFD